MTEPAAPDHALEAPLRGLPSVRASLTKPANWLQLVQFGMVGASGFVVNTIVFAVCVAGFDVEYHLAAVLAFSVAVTNNFLWNRLWTFRHRRTSSPSATAKQGARFLAVSVCALLPSLALLHVFVQAGLGKIGAQMLAVCLVVPISFLGNKLWSFR